jgi:hypothetical protein
VCGKQLTLEVIAMPEFLTTAAVLLAYEKELREGGFDAELVRDLVSDAARAIVREGGLGVINV